MKVYTIGHSTRSIDEFITLLKAYSIKQLVDIRTIPGSRYNPQFSQGALRDSLKTGDITYIYIEQLGGLRSSNKKSVNMGWRNKSFRSYADYMQTDEFKKGIKLLVNKAKKLSTAIMCAEAVPWRCHRSLVGDALFIRKIDVINIMTDRKLTKHTLTSFAHVEGIEITYPAYDEWHYY